METRWEQLLEEAATRVDETYSDYLPQALGFINNILYQTLDYENEQRVYKGLETLTAAPIVTDISEVFPYDATLVRPISNLLSYQILIFDENENRAQLFWNTAVDMFASNRKYNYKPAFREAWK